MCDYEVCKGCKKETKVVNATVMSKSFWNGVNCYLKIFSPIFWLLCMVDSDTYLSIGFIVGELLIAKREIMVVNKNIEKGYKTVISIIEDKTRYRLNSSLRLVA